MHMIDKGIDTGKILHLERMTIEFRSTVAETISWNYARLLRHSAGTLVRVINDFESIAKFARPQGSGRKFTTPTLWQYFRIWRQHRRLCREATAKAHLA